MRCPAGIANGFDPKKETYEMDIKDLKAIIKRWVILGISSETYLTVVHGVYGSVRWVNRERSGAPIDYSSRFRGLC